MLARKLVALVLLALLVSIRTVAFAQDNPPTGSLGVSDQPVDNGTVTVTEVVASQDGWVAVHTFGPTGQLVLAPVAGLTAVKAGTNSNVQVRLNKVYEPGTKLTAMLHIDAGTINTYEFPNGPDVPVTVDGNTVMMEFTIQSAASAPAPAPPPPSLPNTGEAPVALPNTGMSSGTVTLLVGLALLALLVGFGLNWNVHRRTSVR